jgi:hypothetical protein
MLDKILSSGTQLRSKGIMTKQLFEMCKLNRQDHQSLPQNKNRAMFLFITVEKYGFGIFVCCFAIMGLK